MKRKIFPIKMSKEEIQELKNLAKEEGHQSVAGFVKWLIYQFRTGKLVRRK